MLGFHVYQTGVAHPPNHSCIVLYKMTRSSCFSVHVLLQYNITLFTQTLYNLVLTSINKTLLINKSEIFQARTYLANNFSADTPFSKVKLEIFSIIFATLTYKLNFSSKPFYNIVALLLDPVLTSLTIGLRPTNFQ